MNIVQVAEIVGAGVCLLAVVLALRTPFCARRNYLRTLALIPAARRLWMRHAIAQECAAYSGMVIGIGAFPFDPLIRLALAASGGLAFFAAALIEWPGLNPFSFRCRQSAEAAIRAYRARQSQDGVNDGGENTWRQRNDIR